MQSVFYARSKTVLRRTALAVATVTACAGASAALPQFTFNPAAVGLAGTVFTADNLLISDYAVVTNTATGFTETGFLAITNAQLGPNTFQPAGLTSSYGLYIAFSGTGTNVFSNGGFGGGTFNSLSYTMYGYNGPATFTPTSAPTPLVTLATGSLDPSMTSTFQGTTSSGGQVTSASANAFLTFSVAPGAQGFFVSPTSFYTLAQSAFNNTLSEITTTRTGFVVTQGGGSVNFVAAPIPEPETYALLLAGLGVVGFMARRRNRAN